MVIKLHHTSLTSLQQSLLAAYFYFMLIGDVEAAETYGNKFDNIYKYK